MNCTQYHLDNWISTLGCSVCAEEHTYDALLLLLLSRVSHVWLCKPTDRSPPGSSTSGIFQARTLEWVAIAFSASDAHHYLILPYFPKVFQIYSKVQPKQMHTHNLFSTYS